MANATLGPVTEGNQTLYDQSAFATTASTVPAVATVGAVTLITQLDAIIATLLAEIATNRKLINRLIDDLQASKLAR